MMSCHLFSVWHYLVPSSRLSFEGVYFEQSQNIDKIQRAYLCIMFNVYWLSKNAKLLLYFLVITQIKCVICTTDIY